MGYDKIQTPPRPRALFFTTRLLREEEHTLQNEREVAESLLLDMMPRTGPCEGPPPPARCLSLPPFCYDSPLPILRDFSGILILLFFLRSNTRPDDRVVLRAVGSSSHVLPYVFWGRPPPPAGGGARRLSRPPSGSPLSAPPFPRTSRAAADRTAPQRPEGPPPRVLAQRPLSSLLSHCPVRSVIFPSS